MGDAILERYIHNGIIYSELLELFRKLFQSQSFAGLDLRMNQTPIRLTLKVLNPQEIIGENKFKLKQLQNMVAQRLEVPTNNIEIIFEKIAERGLEPAVQAELLRQSFMQNQPYKRTVNAVIKNVRAAGGQGCVIRVAGKLTGQRAKAIKYMDGLVLRSGSPAKEYVKTVKTEAKLKQGIIGIQVSIMLPYDPEGIKGPSSLLPDKIIVLEPKTYN